MKKYRLNNENRQVFLNGLQQYKNQGVSILVDGEKAEAPQWEKVLEEYEVSIWGIIFGRMSLPFWGKENMTGKTLRTNSVKTRRNISPAEN